MVTTLWKRLATHPNLTKYDLSSLKMGSLSAAPGPEALKSKIFELFPVNLLFKLVCYSGAVALIVYPVSLLPLSHFSILAIGGIAYAVVYLTTCFKFDLIDQKDKKFMIDWLLLKPLFAK